MDYNASEEMGESGNVDFDIEENEDIDAEAHERNLGFSTQEIEQMHMKSH